MSVSKSVDLKELSDILGFDVDYTPRTIKRSVLDIPEGNYKLTDDGVGWTDLPSKTYVNKSACGCGATWLAISNDVDYVIACPYIRLIENKMEEHDNIIAVYGGIKESVIKDKYDKNKSEGVPIKFMITYEGLSRLMGFDWFNPSEFKLMVDECHDLVNFGLFRRGSVNFILNNYDKFRDYVFVTATPNKEQFLPKQLSGLEHLTLNWASAKSTQLNIQKVTRNGNDFIVEKCRQYLNSEIDGSGHFFYNSVKEIIAVCKAVMALPNYKEGSIKIVCGDNDHNRRNINKVGEGLLSKTLSNPRLINFYTSCVFEGCDIMDKYGRIYIIVNGRRSSSKICMTTLVPQILGRIRDTVYDSEVSMLVCGNIDCIEYSREDWLQVVANNLLNAKSTVDTYNHAKTLPNSTKILNTLRNSAVLDPYLIVNEDKDLVINEGAMQAEMQRYDIIHAQYKTLSKNSGDSKPNSQSIYKTNIVNDAFQPLGGVYKSVVNKMGDYRVIMKQYIEAIEGEDTETIEFIELHSPVCKRHLSLVPPEKVKALKYRKKAVEAEYEVILKKNSKFYEVLDFLNYKEGDIVTGKEVVASIRECYERLGIAGAVSSRTIREYYNVKDKFFTRNGKNCRGYEVISKIGMQDLTEQQVNSE